MRMTSAPSWARCSPQDGPAMKEAASTTRSPASTSCIAGRRDQRREGTAEELAVPAAGQGGHEEDLLRQFIRRKPPGSVFQDLRGIHAATPLPHDEAGDDADVGAHPVFG